MILGTDVLFPWNDSFSHDVNARFVSCPRKLAAKLAGTVARVFVDKSVSLVFQIEDSNLSRSLVSNRSLCSHLYSECLV